jgi:hypothetical protein
MKTVFPDQKACLERIGRHLVENVPASWHRIDALVELFDDGAMETLTFDGADGGLKQEPFIIEDAEESVAFANCFHELARLLAVGNAAPFKKCHYQISSSGKYHADYEY